MNTNILAEAMDYIDDDLISQAYSYSRGRPKFVKSLAVAAVFAAVLITAFAAIKYSDAFITALDSGDSSTTAEYFGGFMPDKISDGELEYEGTPFTEKEISTFVEKNKYDLIGAIAAEYGDFESVYKISTSGYSHVNLGETNTLRYDYVDLPICRGNEIIAKITLFRSDGELNYTISVRGKAFDKYNGIYQGNSSAELAFFYYGFEELIVTPTNHIYRVHGNEETLEIDRSINYYEKYATEYNTFSYNELTDEKKYITVKPLPEEQINDGSAYTSSDIEEETAEAPETSTDRTVNIYIEDLMSKEITSVEWGRGYDLMLDRPFRVCTEAQKSEMLRFIENMKPTEAAEPVQYFGGGYIVRLVYADGTRASIVLMGGDQIYFETSEGVSPIYIDANGNASALAEYIVSLI